MIIEELHRAIIDTIRKEIPQIITYGAYPKIRSPIKAPAFFVDMTALERGDDPATNQIALTLRMEARIIVGSDSTSAMRTRELAAKIASVIHHNNFGVKVSPAKFVGAHPDGFRPELDAYEVWLIEWTHQIDVGESVWDDSEGIVPQTVYLGYASEDSNQEANNPSENRSINYDLIAGVPC